MIEPRVSRRRPARPLALDTLEPRIAMTVSAAQALGLSAASPLSFFDSDGSIVRIRMTGPGSGKVTLADGTTAGDAIDSIALSGTSDATKLLIVSVGGRKPGTTIRNLTIEKTASATAALDSLQTVGVDLLAGGEIEADGSVKSIRLRTLGAGSGVSVTGNLGSLQARSIAPNASIDVSGSIGVLEARALGYGGFVSAGDRIERMAVQGSVGRQLLVVAGAGGIGRLELGSLEESLVTSLGPIGDVLIAGNMKGSSIVSNVSPGRDFQFGKLGEFDTIDDVITDRTVAGGIGTVRIRGTLTGIAGTNQSFGIESANGSGIGDVIVRGKVLTSETDEGFSADGLVSIQNVGPTFGGSLDAPAYAVSEYMTDWGPSAPTYAQNVAYTSDSRWENVRVINYTPSHYARVDKDGVLRETDGTLLTDPSFQNEIGTDLPNAALNRLSMSFLLGNPEITIEQDLRQLQNAGFTGVRLYGVPAKVAIATIQAAYKLSHEPGSKGAFYVDYEVDTPDLSKPPYSSGTVSERIQALYATLTATEPNPNEGGFQTLHYVINMVTPAVFSEIVPLVFFGHENLVQPPDSDTVLTDDNSSVPLLRWGINATRELLDRELGSQKLPSVTTALLAGQAIQVSKDIHPLVETLVKVILADAGSPIAYDNYPYQWANAYFNTIDTYLNDDQNIIANAYPTNTDGSAIQYIDKTVVDGVKWETGEPKIGKQYTMADTVNKADLMWSLQWMVDRVNWVWGHLQGSADGKVKQLIAETGWASEGVYNDKLDGTGRVIDASMEDAKAYYQAIATNQFEIGGVPVMYFSAYDEPVKNVNPLLSSENHYGVFRWTGIPKYTADDGMHPLTGKFGVMSIAPTNPGVPSTPQYIASLNQGPKSGSYAYSINGGPEVIVPWYAGSNAWTNGSTNRTLFIPNPSMLLADGDKITIRSLQPPANNSPVINLIYDADTDTLTDDGTPTNADHNLKLQVDKDDVSGSWTVFMGYPWLHGGSNEYDNVTKFPRAYADWWAKPSGKG